MEVRRDDQAHAALWRLPKPPLFSRPMPAGRDVRVICVEENRGVWKTTHKCVCVWVINIKYTSYWVLNIASTFRNIQSIYIHTCTWAGIGQMLGNACKLVFLIRLPTPLLKSSGCVKREKEAYYYSPSASLGTDGGTATPLSAHLASMCDFIFLKLNLIICISI